MKKQIITVSVAMTAQAAKGLDERKLGLDINAALRQIDGIESVNSIKVGGYELASSIPEGKRKQVHLFISCEEEDPYFVVEETGSCDKDKPLTADGADALRQVGIVTALYSEYPRSDRYGAPLQVSTQENAFEFVGTHCFVVASEMELSGMDTRDDTPGQDWLTLSVPEDFELQIGTETETAA